MSAAASEPVWHYTSQNQRKGPVTLEILQTLVSKGRLDLEKDMVWNPEMSEWAVAGSVKELAKVKADPSAAPAPAAKTPVPPALSAPAQQAAAPAAQPKKPEKVAETNPYGAPRSQAADTGELQAAMEERKGTDYPGMGRLGYFIVSVLMFCLCVGAIFYVVWQEDASATNPEQMELFGMSQERFELVAQAVVFILFFIPAYSRLRNLSMSGWNYLWNLVPIGNIWLGYRLFACPPGYGEHKKMDGIGRFLAFLYFLPLLLLIAAVVFMVFFGGLQAYKEGADKAQREIDAEMERKEQIYERARSGEEF